MAGISAHGTLGVTNDVHVDGSRECAKWSVWSMPATSVTSVYQIYRDILPVDSLIRIVKVTRSVVRLPPNSRINDLPTVMFEITTSAPKKETLPGSSLFVLGHIYSANNYTTHSLTAWLDTLYPIPPQRDNRQQATPHSHMTNNALPVHFNWRIRPHRPYPCRTANRIQRRQENPATRYQPKVAKPRIISWNIRTATNNRPVLAKILEKHSPQVLVIQEHLIPAQTFPLRMRGYHTMDTWRK
jgi:hypothetical protein